MRIMSQSLIVSMVIESSVRMLALTFEGLCTPSQNFLTSCSGFGTPTYSTSPFRSLSVVIGRYRSLSVVIGRYRSLSICWTRGARFHGRYSAGGA